VRFQPSGEVYIVLGNVLANMREEVAQGVMRNEFEVLAEI
jgi:hypothetical protein